MNAYAPLPVTASGDASRNDELPASVIKIMEGALVAIAQCGAKRLSMSDISAASGVSRGTLYRYFSTKEDVMTAVAEFSSTAFEAGVRAAAASRRDPIDRFRAVMHFFSRFTIERTPERMLEVEPSFYLAFFRSHFGRHVSAVRDALSETIDHVDRMLGVTIGRDRLAESLVRMQLSTILVPADRQWIDWWDAAPEHVVVLIGNLAVAAAF